MTKKDKGLWETNQVDGIKLIKTFVSHHYRKFLKRRVLNWLTYTSILFIVALRERGIGGRHSLSNTCP